MLHIAGRTWIGTPFKPQQSAKLIGCDCAGFITGVWEEVVGELPEAIEPYAQDEPGRQGRETLLEPLRRHMEEVTAIQPGVVVAWRWPGGRFAQHLSIASKPGWMIHADNRFGVVEVPNYPLHRIAGVFRLWPQ